MACLLCSVCQEQAKSQNEEWHVTQCGHTFHRACLEAALEHQLSCPNCRELVRARKGHFKLYLSDYTPPTPLSQPLLQEYQDAASVSEVELLRDKLKTQEAREDELRDRFKALKEAKRDVDDREVRLRECYQELLQGKEQMMEEHRNQLHEQSKLSREKDKRQKAEYDQLQRKHDQLIRKYELLRLQQDKCLKRDEIDKIMDRVRHIDGDGGKRSKREAELSRQLGERNADYRNLVGQFQGVNAERDQAVQKASILEKDLRAQRKAVRELEETLEILQGELEECQYPTPGRRHRNSAGAAGRKLTPVRGNPILYDTPSDEYDWRRPELASKPAYEVTYQMGPPSAKPLAHIKGRNKQAADARAAWNGRVSGAQRHAGGNGADATSQLQHDGPRKPIRSMRDIVEKITVLPESELVVVPESGWGENLFEEAPAAPAHSELAAQIAADVTGRNAVSGTDGWKDESADELDEDVLADDGDVEEWDEEPKRDRPGQIGGAVMAIADQASEGHMQADSDVTQVSDEETDLPGILAAEDMGNSGGGSTAGRATSPSGDGAYVAKEQPGRPSTGSHPASGKSWRDLPLRERMVALRRTSELQKTPLPPATGQTPQAGSGRNGVSLAAGTLAVGPQTGQQPLSGGLSDEQQQAHERQSRADLASARIDAIHAPFDSGALEPPARKAKPQLLIPPAPQQQQALEKLVMLQSPTRGRPALQSLRQLARDHNQPEHSNLARVDSCRKAENPARRQLARLYDDAEQGMAETADLHSRGALDGTDLDNQAQEDLEWSIHLSSDDDAPGVLEHQPAEKEAGSGIASGRACRGAQGGPGTHRGPAAQCQQEIRQRQGLELQRLPVTPAASISQEGLHVAQRHGHSQPGLRATYHEEGSAGRCARDASLRGVELEDEKNGLDRMVLPGDMAPRVGRRGPYGGGEPQRAAFVAEGADGYGGRTKVLLPSNRSVSFTSFDQRPGVFTKSTFVSKKRPAHVLAPKTKRTRGKQDGTGGLTMEHFFAKR